MVLLGIGLGMVNAPITNTAVSGMPITQAGIAAAVASTSRQVGASLGVAIAGSIAGAGVGAARSPNFAASTHPVWWLTVAFGAAIVAIAFGSTGAWARESARRIAPLLENAKRPAAMKGQGDPSRRKLPSALLELGRPPSVLVVVLTTRFPMRASLVEIRGLAPVVAPRAVRSR